MVNPPADCGSPYEWASREQVFEIKGKVGDYRRLADIVRTDLADISPSAWPTDWQKAAVTAKVSFAWADEERTCPAMTGRLSASLAVLCQRCLEPFVLTVATEIDMLLRPAGDGSFDAGGHEIWEIAGDRVCIADIVEELLVMALPLSAKHDSIDLCGELVAEAPVDEAGSGRPFANLRAQMERKN